MSLAYIDNSCELTNTEKSPINCNGEGADKPTIIICTSSAVIDVN